MNLRVSPRRRWLWLGTWKGEALRLWGLSRRGWGGRGRSLTSSRTRAYEILFFQASTRFSMRRGVYTRPVSDFRSAAGRDLTGRANIGGGLKNSLRTPPC